MALEFLVRNQRLKLFSGGPVVADSQQYLKARFTFSEDWQGTRKYAQFRRNGEVYTCNIDEYGEVEVPWETLVGKGVVQISAFATNQQDETNKLITTNPVFVKVETSGIKETELPKTPSLGILGDSVDESLKEITDARDRYVLQMTEIRDVVLEAKDHIDQTDYKIYVGETEPSEDITNAVVWINPAEDDGGSDELAEAVTAAQNAATHAEVQAEIVKKYKALWFDSVAAMKAEPSLTAGAYVNTAGYYEPNDGGGANYLIRSKTDSDVDDAGNLHELANGLVAELIVENGTVCPEQFGAKGDGVADDTSAIQKAVDSDSKLVLFSKHYLVSDDGSTLAPIIKLANNKKYSFIAESDITIKATSNTGYEILSIRDKENITIVNPIVNGDRYTHIGTDGEWGMGIAIRNAKNITILQPKIYNCFGDGMYVDVVDGLFVDYFFASHCRRAGLSIERGKNVNIGTVECEFIDAALPKVACSLEMDNPNSSLENINIGKIISRNTPNAFCILYDKDLQSTEQCKIEVNIGTILSYGGYVSIRSAKSNLYSGSIKIDDIFLSDLQKESQTLSEIYSNEYVNTYIKNIRLDNCTNAGKSLLYIGAEESNINGVVTRIPLSNMRIDNLIVNDNCDCYNSLQITSAIGTNNRIKIKSKYPVWVAFSNQFYAGNHIDFTDSDITVNVSQHNDVFASDSEQKFLATTYINDVTESKGTFTLNRWFGIRNMPITFINKSSIAFSTYLNSLNRFPLSKNYTARALDLTNYGDVSQFMVLEDEKAIILKVAD